MTPVAYRYILISETEKQQTKTGGNDMKYLVIAQKWSEEDHKIINYIAGAFDEFMNARIFAEAYNRYYKANATVEEAKALLNS